MLTQVEIRNSRGSLLTLSMTDVSSGYSVEDIDGLGPVDAQIVSTSFAGVDGTQFQEARRGERNLLFKLGLQPDYVTTTVEALRQKLYKYFMTKSRVNLRLIYASGLIVTIDGRTEKCIPEIFSDTPIMNISIICNDSDFVEIDSETVTGDSTSDTTSTLIDYPGNVEVGFDFTLEIDRTLTEFTIYNTTPEGDVISMDFSGDFVAGDILKVGTVTGNKYVKLIRSGVTSDILYAKSPQSGWIELLEGDNYIRVYAVGAAIPWTIVYTPRYGGL